MYLSDVAVGEDVMVRALACETELKQRLMTFGVVKGVRVHVEKISLAKNTIEIIVDDTALALRMEEAMLVEVKGEHEND